MLRMRLRSAAEAFLEASSRTTLMSGAVDIWIQNRVGFVVRREPQNPPQWLLLSRL